MRYVRSALRLVLLLAVGLVAIGRWQPATRVAAAERVDRPNVIVIVADDLGWGDVPWHGCSYAMPHLDRLASQSLKLEAHYVHPMCSPTRAALLSGRYASRFGCTGAQSERVFPFDTVTLASALRSVGYSTALVGKWHLGSLAAWGPNKFGFDYSYGSLGGGVGPYDHKYKRGPYTDTWHRNGQPLDEQGHVTDLIAREAVGFVRQSKGKSAPFFLYLPFTAIHIPMDEPQAWLDKNPRFQEPGERLRAACASHMDDAIGQVLAALDETGQRDETLVLFFGDNGAHDMQANADPKYPGKYPMVEVGHANGSLRGFKSSLYEGGIRSPTIVRWPGHFEPGVVNAPLHACDWFATLAKIVGYQPPRDLRWDGHDIGPILQGHTTAGEPRTLYCLGVNSREQMIRHGAWKLIVKRKGPDELYDLEADPAEQQNVAAAHPDVVADLKRRMQQQAVTDFECKVADPHSRQ